VVFHDRTLSRIAERMPSDREQLIAIPGIGARKLERYGDEILEVVAAG
jgi:superfamily II DNA helicase RecQ